MIYGFISMFVRNYCTRAGQGRMCCACCNYRDHVSRIVLRDAAGGEAINSPNKQNTSSFSDPRAPIVVLLLKYLVGFSNTMIASGLILLLFSCFIFQFESWKKYFEIPRLHIPTKFLLLRQIKTYLHLLFFLALVLQYHGSILNKFSMEKLENGWISLQSDHKSFRHFKCLTSWHFINKTKCRYFMKKH